MSSDLRPVRCGNAALAIFPLHYMIQVSETGVESHPYIRLGIEDAVTRWTLVFSLLFILLIRSNCGATVASRTCRTFLFLLLL